jgi:hypothetical protein
MSAICCYICDRQTRKVFDMAKVIEFNEIPEPRGPEIPTADEAKKNLQEKAKNEKLSTIPTIKPELNMLPYNDVEDVVLLVCEFINDIVNKATVFGYLDNLPLLVAAWTGKENIIPQLKDLTVEEKEALVISVKNKLDLSEGAERIADKALNLIWAGNELRIAIEEAK